MVILGYLGAVTARVRQVGWVAGALGLMTSLLSHQALAAGTSIPMDHIKGSSIRLNGVLSDWHTRFTPLTTNVSGSTSGSSDARAEVGVAYDNRYLYVAAEVTDNQLTRTAAYKADTEDSLRVRIAFPGAGGGYRPVDLRLYAGKPGSVGGAVKSGGRKLRGAKLVEAPTKRGYTFEAKIPWPSLPPARRTRAGMRVSVSYHDSDGGKVHAVMGNTRSQAPSSWPALLTEPERSVVDGFLPQHGLAGTAPEVDVSADITGDSMAERVMVWGQLFVILGPHFQGGKKYYFHDLGGEPSKVKIQDRNGDGKADIFTHKRVWHGRSYRETVELVSFKGDKWQPLLSQEIASKTESGKMESGYEWKGSGSKLRLIIKRAKSQGLSSSNYRVPTLAGVFPMLTPWGNISERELGKKGSAFAILGEVKGKGSNDGGGAAKAASPPAAPPPPKAHKPTGDELQNQLLDLYKRDRKIPAGRAPRFDLATNVAEGTENERMLVFGKNLVVFGKGFLGGRSYVTVSLGFANEKDVVDVTTRDLTGDGHAEILVRGIQRVAAPKELGKGELKRDILLVYRVEGKKILRVFAAELGLRLGKKSLHGTIAFNPASPGLELHLGPGFGRGWDKSSWPYKQDTKPVGGIEPLTLPWTNDGATYRWDGSRFGRAN